MTDTNTSILLYTLYSYKYTYLSNGPQWLLSLLIYLPCKIMFLHFDISFITLIDLENPFIVVQVLQPLKL